MAIPHCSLDYFAVPLRLSPPHSFLPGHPEKRGCKIEAKKDITLNKVKEKLFFKQLLKKQNLTE